MLQESLAAALRGASVGHPSGDADPRAHASEAGMCGRAVWYRINRFAREPRPLQSLLATTIGSHLHPHMQAALADIYPDFRPEVEWRHEYVSGHADGLYTDPAGVPVVAEIKTMHNRSFHHAKEPKPDHWLQACVNAVGLGATHAHVIYVNTGPVAGEDTIREWVRTIDAFAASRELLRLGRIATEDETPARSDGADSTLDPEKTKFPCSYCPYRAQCIADGE